MGSIISKKSKNLNSLSRLRNATDKTNNTQKEVRKFVPTNIPAIYKSPPAAEIATYKKISISPKPQLKNESQSQKSNEQVYQPTLKQGVINRVAEHAPKVIKGVAEHAAIVTIGNALGNTIKETQHRRNNNTETNNTKSLSKQDYTVSNENKNITKQENEELTEQEIEISGQDKGFNKHDDTPEDTEN